MYEMPMNNNFVVNPYNPFQPRQQQGFPGQPQIFPGQQSQNLIRVTGAEGAKAYQMPPNSSVALFDEGEDIFYVKTTDGAGFPTVRAFAFTPIEINQPAKPQGDYVTRAEFEELKGMIVNGKQSVRKSKSNPADGGEDQ